MVTLHRRPNWKVSVYGREHGVPHFHIEGPGFRCSVGSVPTAIRREALDWAEKRQAELLAKWQELNP